MHALLVPPVDTVDHSAARHLTTAVHTALSGSVVLGAFLRPESARHLDTVGQAVGEYALHGDYALHEGTARLFTACVGGSGGKVGGIARGSAPHPTTGRRGYVGALGFPPMSAASA